MHALNACVLPRLNHIRWQDSSRGSSSNGKGPRMLPRRAPPEHIQIGLGFDLLALAPAGLKAEVSIPEGFPPRSRSFYHPGVELLRGVPSRKFKGLLQGFLLCFASGVKIQRVYISGKPAMRPARSSARCPSTSFETAMAKPMLA